VHFTISTALRPFVPSLKQLCEILCFLLFHVEHKLGPHRTQKAHRTPDRFEASLKKTVSKTCMFAQKKIVHQNQPASFEPFEV
jgi:hypothetical protein